VKHGTLRALPHRYKCQKADRANHAGEYCHPHSEPSGPVQVRISVSKRRDKLQNTEPQGDDTERDVCFHPSGCVLVLGNDVSDVPRSKNESLRGQPGRESSGEIQPSRRQSECVFYGKRRIESAIWTTSYRQCSLRRSPPTRNDLSTGKPYFWRLSVNTRSIRRLPVACGGIFQCQPPLTRGYKRHQSIRRISPNLEHSLRTGGAAIEAVPPDIIPFPR
jgi:hypothetical protein